MKYFVSIFALFLALAAFGQKTIDTVLYGQKWKLYIDSTGQKVKEVTFYNNGKTKYVHLFRNNKGARMLSYDSNGIKVGEAPDPGSEKIDTNSKGQKIKETLFYANGKIESEHFFEDNKGYRWVSYDSNGVKTNEWFDPEVQHARFQKLRNVVLLLTGILLSALIALGWKFIGYRRTYFLIVFASVLYPVIALFFNARLDNLNERVSLIIISAAMELPLFLLALSIRNLNKLTAVPKLLSIAGILISIGLILLFVYSIVMASIGPGIIG